MEPLTNAEQPEKPKERDLLKELDELKGRLAEIELGLIEAAKLSILALKVSGYKVIIKDDKEEKGN